MTRFLAVFQVHSPAADLRISEILNQFRILSQEDTVYSGRATVKNLIDGGQVLVCEVVLDESAWMDLQFSPLSSNSGVFQAKFGEFFQEWQKSYKVDSSYKAVVADLHTFLTDLRLWLEQVELGIRSMPNSDGLQREREISEELAGVIFPPLDILFDRFEKVAAVVEKDLEPVHQVYARRQLQPLLLCAPFAFRSVAKPLGYAGDYEIVNMILRDPHEGASLYAKMLNRWFIKQPPAEAHRNRVTYLKDRLVEETLRLRASGRPLRVFNVGSGPAKEVQDFLAQSELCETADFTLVDFNEETLRYGRSVIESCKSRHGRKTKLQFVKKSVAQLLKSKVRAFGGSSEKQYDFVYCAGLLDYLTDTVSKQLINIMYEMVAPGGLCVVTNVDTSNPIQNWLGYVLEWHLIYRDGKQMEALRPENASPEDMRVVADTTGVNIFLELRKPA